MERLLRHIRTLVYYDGPQVYLAEDQISTKYICVQIPDKNHPLCYLCTSVSIERFEDFLSKLVDLRAIFIKSETREFFKIHIANESFDASAYDVLDFDDLTEDILPDEGFFLDIGAENANEIEKEALLKDRVIFQLHLKPPESRSESIISSSHLATVLSLIQTLIKHAYQRTISSNY